MPPPLPGITEDFARFIAALAYDDLPRAVVERAKSALLDWAGAALVGSTSDSAWKLVGLLDELGGSPEATVVAQGRRYPALHAALANGAMAAVHEVDDAHHDCRIHPGLPVISAVLALAERQGTPGRRVIEAIVAGYEVTVRLAAALGVHHNDYWHSTGTAGAVGAAAASCKVLGLAAAPIAGALGLGATQAAGLIDGIEGRALAAKHFHGGKAAQNGILAALLASRDYLGSPTVIEGEWGFLRAFSRATLEERQAAVDGLGARWAILRNIFKPFACCLAAQPGVHAVLGLVTEHALGPDDIAAIDAAVHPSALYMTRNPDPRTPLQAKFSLPFCLAAAVVYRDLGVRVFDEPALGDARVRGLMARVRLEARDDLTRVQTRIDVRTRDDRTLRRIAERRSLSADEVEPKFRCLVDGLVKPHRADEIVEWIATLDARADLLPLGRLLGAQ